MWGQLWVHMWRGRGGAALPEIIIHGLRVERSLKARA